MLIILKLVAIDNESPYPWKNLATQQQIMNAVGYVGAKYAQTPSAVLLTKMQINPIIRAFFRPILLIVIAWIGE